MGNIFTAPPIRPIPAPEPAGFDVLRRFLMEKVFNLAANPYGLNSSWSGSFAGNPFLPSGGSYVPFDPRGGWGGGLPGGAGGGGTAGGGGGVGGGSARDLILALSRGRGPAPMGGRRLSLPMRSSRAPAPAPGPRTADMYDGSPILGFTPGESPWPFTAPPPPNFQADNPNWQWWGGDAPNSTVPRNVNPIAPRDPTSGGAYTGNPDATPQMVSREPIGPPTMGPPTGDEQPGRGRGAAGMSTNPVGPSTREFPYADDFRRPFWQMYDGEPPAPPMAPDIPPHMLPQPAPEALVLPTPEHILNPPAWGNMPGEGAFDPGVGPIPPPPAPLPDPFASPNGPFDPGYNPGDAGYVPPPTIVKSPPAWAPPNNPTGPPSKAPAPSPAPPPLGFKPAPNAGYKQPKYADLWKPAPGRSPMPVRRPNQRGVLAPERGGLPARRSPFTLYDGRTPYPNQVAPMPDGRYYDGEEDEPLPPAPANPNTTPGVGGPQTLDAPMYPWLTPYTGPITAPMTPEENYSLDELMKFVQGGGGLNDAEGYVSRLLRGDFMGSGSPFLTQIQGGAQTLKDYQDEQALRRIGSSMAAGGNALSGARMGAEQDYIRNSNAGFQDMMGRLGLQNLMHERELQNSGVNAALGLEQGNLGMLRALMDAGALPRQIQQNENMARYNDWLRQIGEMKGQDRYSTDLATSLLKGGGYGGYTDPKYGPSTIEGIMALLAGSGLGNKLLQGGESGWGLVGDLVSSLGGLLGGGGGGGSNTAELGLDDWNFLNEGFGGGEDYASLPEIPSSTGSFSDYFG